MIFNKRKQIPQRCADFKYSDGVYYGQMYCVPDGGTMPVILDTSICTTIIPEKTLLEYYANRSLPFSKVYDMLHSKDTQRVLCSFNQCCLYPLKLSDFYFVCLLGKDGSVRLGNDFLRFCDIAWEKEEVWIQHFDKLEYDEYMKHRKRDKSIVRL